MKKLHGNCKKIDIYTRGNKLVSPQYITTTDSVIEAARICGVTPEMISMCIHGKRKSNAFLFKVAGNGKEEATC